MEDAPEAGGPQDQQLQQQQQQQQQDARDQHEDAVFMTSELDEEARLAHFAEQLTRVLEANDWFALHEEIRPSRRVLSDGTWEAVCAYVVSQSSEAPGDCLVFRSTQDERALVRTMGPGANGIIWAYTTSRFSVPQHLSMLQSMPRAIPQLRSNRALKFLRSFHERFRTAEETDPTAQDPERYLGARDAEGAAHVAAKAGSAPRKRSTSRKRPFSKIELTEDGRHTKAALYRSRQEMARAALVRELRRLDDLGKASGPQRLDVVVRTIIGSFPQRWLWVTTLDVEAMGAKNVRWWSFWRTLDSLSHPCRGADTCQFARVDGYVVVRVLPPALGFRWLYIAEDAGWSQDLHAARFEAFASEIRVQVLARLARSNLFTPSALAPGLQGGPGPRAAAPTPATRRRDDMAVLFVCALAAHSSAHIWYETAELRPQLRVSSKLWQEVLDLIDCHGEPLAPTAPEEASAHKSLRAVRVSIGHNVLVKTREHIFGTAWIYVARDGDHTGARHEVLMGQLLQGQTKAPRHVSVGRPAPELRTVLATHQELLEERDRFDSLLLEDLRTELAKAGQMYAVIRDPVDPVMHLDAESTLDRARRVGAGASKEAFSLSWHLDSGEVTIRAFGSAVAPPSVSKHCVLAAEVSQVLATLEMYEPCPGDGFRHPLFARRCVEVFVDLPPCHQERAARLGSVQRLVVGAVLDDADEVAVVVECATDAATGRAQFRARAADCELFCLRKKRSCEACLRQLNTRIRRSESRLGKAGAERDLGYGHLARAELKVRYDHVVKELNKARRREDRAKEMLNKQRCENRELRRFTHAEPDPGAAPEDLPPGP